MNSNLTLKNLFIPITIFTLFILLYWLSITAYGLPNSGIIYFGITIDLLIIVPAVYFWLIKDRDIPKITVVPVFILSTILAGYIIPESNQSILHKLTDFLVPAVELIVISVIGVKAYSIFRHLKTDQSEKYDFFTSIKKATQEVVPGKIGVFLATELATFYYGFFHWKKRKLSKSEFTYHKENSAIIILGTIIFLVVAETLILHLLISKWSAALALIITLLSIYSGIQVFGMARSLSKRPIRITGNELILRYGIMAEIKIPLNQIESFEKSSKTLEKESGFTKSLSPISQLDGGHNFIIHLKNESEFFSLYGFKKSFKSLAFHVDEKDRFKSALEKSLVKFPNE